MPARNEIAKAEATRDPIFLFQRRRLVVIGFDEDRFELADDPGGFYRKAGDGSVLPGSPYLTAKDLLDETYSDYEIPMVHESWETEYVFLTREEGEAWGKNYDHRYRDGWRVHCVPARRKLAEILAATETAR